MAGHKISNAGCPFGRRVCDADDMLRTFYFIASYFCYHLASRRFFRGLRTLTCPCRFPPVEVRVRPSEGRTDEASQVYGRA
ncbi:hypothetical protein, partial [Bradyrhizobium sp. I1.7.5]|uniref:hypothetical protein n=1 Tax=Bradyrhizobium sp. I1.7.5 TaxID=3156363 RepID=UPI003397EFDA